MPVSQRPDLPPHYYRDNFLQLCDTVQERYADLLLEPERALLQDFRRLPFAAQCLYVRLVSRVGPWFRVDKLAYPEIGDLTAAMDALLVAGMASVPEQLSLEELGRLYTRDEFQRVFGDDAGLPRAAHKSALLDAVAELAPDHATCMARLQTLAGGPVIGPRGVDTVQLLQLLFFGNRRQSLTEFVLSDLGIARYYPYSLEATSRLFPNREALDEYLLWARLGDRHRELIEGNELEGLTVLGAEMVASKPLFPATQRRWYRQCNALARDLERMGEVDLAASLYAGSQRHPARERRARILERGGDWQEAASLCREILAEPWCEEEREAAARILPRVERKLGGPPVPRPREQFPVVELSLPRGEAPVELRVGEHISPQWSSVHYVENRLMNALFGMAFWEEIFAPVAGAFHNPYQSLPADMYEPGFRQQRRELLRDRWSRLRSLDLGRELVTAYRRYEGYQCRWVNWRGIDEELVMKAATIIPDDRLLAIWERLLFDPRENRRGFPDLLALGAAPGDYCLIEVKGPGDTLQDSQKRWLRFFAGNDIPAMVARVSWSDD